MQFVDLTAELEHGMVRHPAPHLPPVEVVPVTTHAEHKRLVSRITFGTHVSTHIDAPLHVIEGGMAVDQIPLETLCGQAALLRVQDVSLERPITSEHLTVFEPRLGRYRRVILNTGWAQQVWGTREYFTEGPYLTLEATRYLAKFDIALLGMDFPNIDSKADTIPGQAAPNHMILLGKGMILLENLLNLESIEAAEFELFALPLRLVGGDGCPCRAIAKINSAS